MTDNELIAEFMGDSVDGPEYENRMVHRQKGGAISVNLLGYHRSWDWLMPVIDKILLWEVQFNTQSEEAKRAQEVTNLKICLEISDVYSAVVTFIKWYNEQK